MEHQTIKDAVDITQRAQRNYDLSKSIPQEDLDTLIYTAINSPSKQNETHFKLKVYTDPNLIHNIYDCTKRFGLIGDNFDKMYKDTDKGVIGNNKYEVICGEETQGWKINDLNCEDMNKWMHTVNRLHDAKLLIANDFDFDKAFGGY